MSNQASTSSAGKFADNIEQWARDDKLVLRLNEVLTLGLSLSFMAALAFIASPVKLPPGRARLVTRPSRTGSSGTAKTMGIVAVAFAANAAAGLPTAAITATRR